MPQLVSVRFRFNPKPLWFDPIGKTYESGTEVLVETERGREAGTVFESAIEATEKDIKNLKSPLKPVIRALTELDFEHLDALDQKGRSAMPFFREKIAEYELDIKPVDVQYLFSGERATFFFSSEERVDFRELVRDLAQHFHVRVDMRQIGARDEAKELGGLAHCGEEFCCTRFGGEFQPVSIRMAKEQDLPLNPAKISGACGRLMCCLRYEYEAYKDFKKRAPKKGTLVDTPLGQASISGYNTPSETMELKLEGGKRLNVPLAEMDCKTEKDGQTCCSINRETIERCATRSMLISLGALDHHLDESLMSSTEELDIEITVDETRSRKRKRRSSRTSDRAPSTSQSATPGKNASSGEEARPQGEETSYNSRRRRRRSTGGDKQKQPQGQSSREAAPDAAKQQRTEQKQSPRRTPRNAAQSSKNTRNAPRGEKVEDSPRVATDKPRPGQMSSGLRKPRVRTEDKAQSKQPQPAQNSATSPESSGGEPRRRRRRRPNNNAQGGSSPNNNAQGNNPKNNSQSGGTN